MFLQTVFGLLLFYLSMAKGDYQLKILLEKFDNSAGGGRLYNSANRCDPFWFSGTDQCDLALQICIELGNTKSNNFRSCSTGWIDLGRVSSNQNVVKFTAEQIYGGWSNPMIFSYANFLQNFTVKVLAEDVDPGATQLVDQMVCFVTIPPSAQNGILSCQHMRPNMLPTMLKLSYIQTKVQPLQCSGKGGWRADACCRMSCPRGFPDPLPVLLVSLDGFRADYLKRNVTMAIQRLIDCGIHTDFMYASYPTKTFPNHYTIVTGLYPESHGIIDNHMYDPTITPASQRWFSLGSPSSFNPQWWHGEPFWNTVMKNGMVAGTYFWPGAEVKIQNMRPNYWFPYNGSVPYLSRVDTIIQWLLYPKEKRPNFMTLYFDEPDHHGHEYGPQSPELVWETGFDKHDRNEVIYGNTPVTKELTVVDGIIDYLMTQLYENNLFHCVNVIIVADHGMKTIIPGAHLDLRRYFNTTNMITFSAPVGRVMLQNSSLTAKDVVSSLKCKNSTFRVYARKSVPKRFHYSRSKRIGDVVVDTDPGLVVSKWPYSIKGTHGWDFRVNSMHALFVAHGPNFKQNYTKESFENIEIYNMLSALLKIKKTAPNNGTNGLMNDLLRFPTHNEETPKNFTSNCPSLPVIGCGNCNKSKPVFGKVPTFFLPSQTSNNNQSLCNLATKLSTVILSIVTVKMPVVAVGMVRPSSAIRASNKNCNFIFQSWIPCILLEYSLLKLAALNNASMYPLFSFDESHPEIREFMIRDPSFKFVAAACTISHLFVAFLLRDCCIQLVLFYAFVVGPLYNCALCNAVHETVHELAIDGSAWWNKVFGNFVNFGLGMPSAGGYYRTHRHHHAYLGTNLDAKYPSMQEALSYDQSIWGRLKFVFSHPLSFGARWSLNVKEEPSEYQIWNFRSVFFMDFLILIFWGYKPLLYLLISFWLNDCIFIQGSKNFADHKVVENVPVTSSYYGTINLINFNIGYHREHHDIPNIPGRYMKMINHYAPEFYQDTKFIVSWIFGGILKMLFAPPGKGLIVHANRNA